MIRNKVSYEAAKHMKEDAVIELVNEVQVEINKKTKELNDELFTRDMLNQELGMVNEVISILRTELDTLYHLKKQYKGEM